MFRMFYTADICDNLPTRLNSLSKKPQPFPLARQTYIRNRYSNLLLFLPHPGVVRNPLSVNISIKLLRDYRPPNNKQIFIFTKTVWLTNFQLYTEGSFLRRSASRFINNCSGRPYRITARDTMHVIRIFDCTLSECSYFQMVRIYCSESSYSFKNTVTNINTKRTNDMS